MVSALLHLSLPGKRETSYFVWVFSSGMRLRRLNKVSSCLRDIVGAENTLSCFVIHFQFSGENINPQPDQFSPHSKCLRVCQVPQDWRVSAQLLRVWVWAVLPRQHPRAAPQPAHLVWSGSSGGQVGHLRASAGRYDTIQIWETLMSSYEIKCSSVDTRMKKALIFVCFIFLLIKQSWKQFVLNRISTKSDLWLESGISLPSLSSIRSL